MTAVGDDLIEAQAPFSGCGMNVDWETAMIPGDDAIGPPSL